MNSFKSIVPEPLNALHELRGHFTRRARQLLAVYLRNAWPGPKPPHYEPEAQISKVFDTISLVLEEAGCAWTNVVELTVYFTILRRDFDLFMSVRDRYISKPYPAMTMVGVTELAQSDLICEVKGVAVMSRTAPLATPVSRPLMLSARMR